MTEEATIPVEPLRRLLDQIDEATQKSASRHGTWESISENVVGYLHEVRKGLGDHDVAKALRLNAERENGHGYPVSLHFGLDRVPMQRSDGENVYFAKQVGATLNFVPTLCGLVAVTAFGFWVELDGKPVGPRPQEVLLGRFEPEALAGSAAVLNLVERFFEHAAKTHWARSETTEV